MPEHKGEIRAKASHDKPGHGVNIGKDSADHPKGRIAANKGKQGHKNQQVGQGRGKLPDGDADFRVNHGSGVAAYTRLQAPQPKAARKPKAMPTKEVRRRVVGKACAADHGAGHEADKNPKHGARGQGLLEENAAQNGADCPGKAR